MNEETLATILGAIEASSKKTDLALQAMEKRLDALEQREKLLVHNESAFDSDIRPVSEAASMVKDTGVNTVQKLLGALVALREKPGGPHKYLRKFYDYHPTVSGAWPKKKADMDLVGFPARTKGIAKQVMPARPISGEGAAMSFLAMAGLGGSEFADFNLAISAYEKVANVSVAEDPLPVLLVLMDVLEELSTSSATSLSDSHKSYVRQKGSSRRISVDISSESEREYSPAPTKSVSSVLCA
jgi:hypothetical protein